jgi:arylsulfatase A-like enzyme
MLCYAIGALLAVDDLVDELIGTLDHLGALQSTYVVFTSDHGYRFGQFGMPQGASSKSRTRNLRGPLPVDQ